MSLKLDSISRHNAIITVNGTQVTLCDLRSKNGTFVNGQQTATAMDLHDGDEIRLGSVAVTFRQVSGDASTVTEIK